MLGKDSDRNEYWIFKEDISRLYVKKYMKAELNGKEDAMKVD